MKQRDFEFEEDFVLAYECEDCKHYEDWGYDEEPEECSECGSNDLINNTSHEDTECDMCRGYIDMWQDGYRYMGDNKEYLEKEDSGLICEDCYEKLDI